MKYSLIPVSILFFGVAIASAQSGVGAMGPRILPSSGIRAAEMDRLIKLGDIADEKGELNDAEKYYRQALEQIDMYYVRFKLTKILVRKNLRSEALDQLRLITDEKKQDLPATDPITLAFYGEVALSAGKKEEARNAYLRAIEHGRESVGDGFPSTTGLVQAGDIRAAALLAAGIKQTLTGQNENALESFGLALKVSPKSDVARFYYASLLAKVGRGRESVSEFEKISNSTDPIVKREASKRIG